MASLPLITPSDCAVVLVDYQAGLAFAAGSADRNGPVVTYRKGKGFSEMPGERSAVSENASKTDPAKLLPCPLSIWTRRTDDAVRKMRRRAPLSIL